MTIIQITEFRLNVPRNKLGRDYHLAFLFAAIGTFPVHLSFIYTEDFTKKEKGNQISFGFL